MTPEERFVDDWMRARGIARFSYDDGAGDEVAGDWIMAQGPDAWHKYAIGFNWDFGADVARWIVDQPGCDKGTAIFLYYAAQPGYYARFESLEAARADFVDDEAFELMPAIAANWARGLYRDYRYYPGRYLAHVLGNEMPVNAEDRLALARAVPWDVPEDLARAGAEGEIIDWDGTSDGFANGIGRALDDAIQARFEPWDEHKQRTGAEDVIDVARRIGETEMPSDATPALTRVLWGNWILMCAAMEHLPGQINPVAKPDLEGTGIPIPPA